MWFEGRGWGSSLSFLGPTCNVSVASGLSFNLSFVAYRRPSSFVSSF